MINQGFTKFELVMGLAVISIGVLLMFPPLQGGVAKDQSTRAESKAETIAWAIQDYHRHTEMWPKSTESGLDLSCLTRTAPMISDPTTTLASSISDPDLLSRTGTMAPTSHDGKAAKPWLQEIPLDPWERPYSVWILDPPANDDNGSIVVLSAGPDGVLQTDPDAWSTSELALAGGHIPDNSTILPEDLFMGDDVGFILAQAELGGLN
ncbi:MAG: hypothetical protein KOO60_09025 [Gemmatimonadales bacterium]|nr:hypothetical protein [Gemmatimonadales bacterium]